MLVSHARRMLFIHVHKTGGTSIEQVLGDLPDVETRAPRHGGLAQAIRNDPRLADYWTFGFVRNPWDRMASWWWMMQTLKAEAERDEPNPRHPVAWRVSRQFKELAVYQTFEAFITDGTRDHARLCKPQISYLTTQTRRADFIGRTETLAADMRAVTARLDLPATELPHANASDRGRDYRDLYTPALRDQITEVFSRDIETFGYTY